MLDNLCLCFVSLNTVIYFKKQLLPTTVLLLHIISHNSLNMRRQAGIGKDGTGMYFIIRYCSAKADRRHSSGDRRLQTVCKCSPGITNRSWTLRLIRSVPSMIQYTKPKNRKATTTACHAAGARFFPVFLILVSGIGSRYTRTIHSAK